MKYRIKIITYANGRKEYYPMIKRRFSWKYLNYKGEVSSYASDYSTREKALSIIDENYSGNVKKQTIEFEYINK